MRNKLISTIQNGKQLIVSLANGSYFVFSKNYVTSISADGRSFCRRPHEDEIEDFIDSIMEDSFTTQVTNNGILIVLGDDYEEFEV